MSPLMLVKPARWAAANAAGPVWPCGGGQRFELAVPGRLHPERDPVDARGPEAAQCFFGDGLGVGFQGDLRPGQGLGSVYEAGNILGCE